MAGADCILLETPHSAIKKLVRTEQSVRAYIDKVYALRALRVSADAACRAGDHSYAVESVGLHRFTPGAEIFKEGDPIERFYLVRSGSVALSRRNGTRTRWSAIARPTPSSMPSAACLLKQHGR